MSKRTDFDALCERLQFTDETREAAWSALLAAKVGPDDPEVTQLLMPFIAMDAERRQRAVLADVEKAISAAGTAAAARLERAAAASIKADGARHAADEAKMLGDLSAKVAEVAHAAMERRARTAERNSVATVATVAVCLALGAWGAGWHYGADAQRGGAAAIVRAAGADADTWATIIGQNDLRAALASCKSHFPAPPGSCSVRLDTVPTRSPDRLMGLLGFTNDFLNTLPWWFLALAVFQIQRAGRFLLGATKGWTPLRLILGLPLKSPEDAEQDK